MEILNTKFITMESLGIKFYENSVIYIKATERGLGVEAILRKVINELLKQNYIVEIHLENNVSEIYPGLATMAMDNSCSSVCDISFLVTDRYVNHQKIDDKILTLFRRSKAVCVFFVGDNNEQYYDYEIVIDKNSKKYDRLIIYCGDIVCRIKKENLD